MAEKAKMFRPRDARSCLTQAPELLKDYLIERGVDLEQADELGDGFWVMGDKLPSYGMLAGSPAEACLVLGVDREDSYYTAPVIIDLRNGKKRSMAPKNQNDITRSRPFFPSNFEAQARVVQLEKPVGALAASSNGATNIYSINGAGAYTDPRHVEKTLHPEVKDLCASGLVEELLLGPDSDAGYGQDGRGNPEVNRQTQANVALHRKETPNIRIGVISFKPSYNPTTGYTKRGAEDWIGDIGWEATEKVFINNPSWHTIAGIQLDPAKAAPTGIFNKLPTAPEFIVEGLIPKQVGVISATGGVGKTTFLLWLSIHVALGKPFLGHVVTRPGPVLYVTGEDERNLLLYRLALIGEAMKLTPAEKASLEKSIYIEDVSEFNARLVEADRNQNIAQTAFLDTVINTYADKKPALVVLDPLVHFGPGERFVNDGASALVTAARRLYRELNSAALFVHHVSLETAKGKVIKQHAGRGPAALGDGVRFEWQLASSRAYSNLMPASITPASFITEPNLSAYALHVHKLSASPLPLHPYWVTRSGHHFQYHKGVFHSAEALHEETSRLHSSKVVAYIKRHIKIGGPLRELTRTQLREGAKEKFGFGKHAVTEALDSAVADGQLMEVTLPAQGRVGPRATYYAPVVGV